MQLLDLFAELVDGSLHYSTAAEEKPFLAEAAEFVNFEGASLFNRVVITESPERVIDLIQHHVFDKFGPLGRDARAPRAGRRPRSTTSSSRACGPSPTTSSWRA